MNFFGKIQSEYEQLWKLIIRPARTPYKEEILGPSYFKIKNKTYLRKDFELTNQRGFNFACSLWLPTTGESVSCVVYLHGNSSNRSEGMEYLRKLLINNIALCTFDFSGCGNAQGEYISLGYYEQQDLELVVQHLTMYPQINKLALWGRSMGAVTALLYLSHHQTIASAIFDSPFKSLKDLVEDMGSKTSKVPSFILNGGLKIISKTILDKGKFDIFNLNPYKQCAPGIMVPGFFIVGIEDEIIPLQHTKDLFEVYGSDDKVIKMVKGRHNDKRPSSSIKEVIKFLIKNFNKGQEQHQDNISQILKSQESPEKLSFEQTQQKKKFSWPKMSLLFRKQQKKQKSQDDELHQQKERQRQIQKKAKHQQIKKQLNSFSYQLKEVQDLDDKLKEYSYCYM